jgi:xylulokinase
MPEWCARSLSHPPGAYPRPNRPAVPSPTLRLCRYARPAPPAGEASVRENPAAAIGAGVTREGVAFTTIGSSAVVYAVSDAVRIDLEGRVHTLCASVPGKWTVMSCTQAAGLSLQWLRDTVCQPEAARAAAEGKDPYAVMDGLARGVPPGAGKLLFLPYLMGERSPHPDPDCRGAFVGLSAIHGRAEMIRAVLEGVAYSQRECVDVFREMGVGVGDMLACGGGARSALWRGMLADLYGCPVSLLGADEGPALGAALLAGVASGVYKDVDEACAAGVRRGEAVAPDPAAGAAYEPYFKLYKRLYRDLSGAFKELAAI